MSNEWSGDRLNRPEVMQAFTGQLRRHLSEYLDFVAHMRRDAEAMWRENPPEGYSSFEAWWRHGRVTAPFAEIEEHLAKAVKLTFRLEARYRKHRHTVPERRQAAAEAKLHAAIPSGSPPEQPQPVQPPARRRTKADEDFLAMLQQGRSA
jgi:hypothetical protein